MLRSFGLLAALACILLQPNVAYDHILKASHETLQNDFVLNRNKDDAAVAGTALDDADMTHLTDSIQGLFSDAAPVSTISSKQGNGDGKVAEKLSKSSPPAPKPSARQNLRKASNAQTRVAVAHRKEAAPRQIQKVIQKQETKTTKTIVKLEHSTKTKKLLQQAKSKMLGKKKAVVKVETAKQKTGPLLVKTIRTALKPGLGKDKQAVREPHQRKSSADHITSAEKLTRVLAQHKLDSNHITAPKLSNVVAEQKTAKVVAEKKLDNKSKSTPSVAELKTAKVVAEKKNDDKSQSTPRVTEQKIAKVVAEKKLNVKSQNAPNMASTKSSKKEVIAEQTHETKQQSTPASRGTETPKKSAAAQDVKVAKAAEPKRETPPVKIQAVQKAKVASSNKTANTSQATNASVTQVTNASSNGTKMVENKTKEIEEAVETLPMASFALDDPKPVANTSHVISKNRSNATEHSQTNNTADNATWASREQMLENEIASLKQKLSERSPAGNGSAMPAAIGTFSVQPTNVDKKPVISNNSDTKSFLVKDDREKSTAQSVSDIAKVKQSDKPGSSSPKDAHDSQESGEKKMSMSEAFSGTPAKKVESALEINAAVGQVKSGIADEQDSSPVSDALSAVSASQSAPESFFGWVSSFFSWIFGISSPTPAQPVIQQTATTAPTKKQPALLQARWLKQDMEKTARATEEESHHTIAVNDAFGQMESEDIKEESEVRREDVAERERAETPEIPQAPNKDALKGRHGTEMSSFWSQLEREDSDIEHSVDAENLGEYERLTNVQEERVVHAATALQDNKLSTDQVPPLKHHDVAQLAIHDPWLKRETMDKLLEKKIHESPDLQMLQLRNKHRQRK